MRRSRTVQNRDVWIQGSATVVVLGLAALVAGVRAGTMAWILLGLIAIVAGIVAIGLHRGLGDQPARSPVARRRRLRGELATWVATLPLAVVLLPMATAPTALPPSATRVSGKPAEIGPKPSMSRCWSWAKASWA